MRDARFRAAYTPSSGHTLCASSEDSCEQPQQIELQHPTQWVNTRPRRQEFETKREWRKYEFELSFTFKNKKNEQLGKEAGKIEGQPFDIAECEGCEIVITDHCDQVQIDQLKTCRVFLGASSESVFVRDCSDCTFYLACKQLRTRDCHNCTFYLRAKTEPIIELSDGICFAPFLGGIRSKRTYEKCEPRSLL